MEIDKIASLQLQPDDILVLNYGGKLNESAYAMLKKQLEIHLPNIKSVILEQGMTLQVLKPALKWTKERPIITGWYWNRVEVGGEISIEIVEVYDPQDLYVRFSGSDCDESMDSMSRDIEWYGPIEPPEYR